MLKKERKKGEGLVQPLCFLRRSEDTYFGLAILDLCQSLDEISTAKHLSYLSTISWQELLPETLLYYLKALFLLDGAMSNLKELEKYLDEFFGKSYLCKKACHTF